MKPLLTAVLIMAFAIPVYPQSPRPAVFQLAESRLFEILHDHQSTIRNLSLPSTISAALDLQAMIRDDRFPLVESMVSDRELADLLYLAALKETDGNEARALLCVTAGVLEHRYLPFNFFFGIRLFVPLSVESDSDFVKRTARLPRRLFADTPEGSFGDQDKLQHFFGSAYLTMRIRSAVADLIGEGVEYGEALFLAGGTRDPRDVATNERGQAFANALLRGQRALPSEFLGSSLAGNSPTDSSK